MNPLPRLLPLAVIALLGADIAPAAAQFAAPQGQPGARPARPPALPGLAARRAPEPIPADDNANLSPTPALFDAITRGDLAAARDAVNRGADLNGRNALGLTPTDWAVDQGRNDILFFLLSSRGMAGNASGPTNARSAAAARAEQERAAQQEALRLARQASAHLLHQRVGRHPDVEHIACPHVWAASKPHAHGVELGRNHLLQL